MALTKYRTHYIPVAGTIISIIGFIYSLFMTFEIGQDVLCLTTGCTVVRDFKIFGVSPWLLSSALFLLIAVLCIFRWRVPARFVANFFLLGDCLFLLLMTFIAPCVNCLGVALIIFLLWAALRIDRGILGLSRRIIAGTMSVVWLVLFTLNVGHTLNDIIPAWTLENDESQHYRMSVFFSPSCPACREAIVLFSEQASFYPVAENEADFAVIHELADRLEEGENIVSAMQYIEKRIAEGEPAPTFGMFERMVLKIKVMRNQALLLRLESHSLPTLVFEGMPRSWSDIRQNPGQTAAEPGAARGDSELGGGSSPNGQAPELNLPSPDLPLDFEDPMECETGATEPCD